MSLCRFYPQPSDRMAIIWSLMPIQNGIVLEYGPAGTTHFGGGMYSSLGLELKQSLFTTHISEDDVIMGDVSRLEQAIIELDQAYEPKVIFVVASAVIAVIGTDIEGVCTYMQEKVNARLIALADGGFRGDYTYGLRAAYKLLAKELMGTGQPVKGEKLSYQILGASAGSYRVRSDIWEIKELMREAFGAECRLVLGLECSVEELEAAGEAAFQLVIRCEALEAAEILKEKNGTPYVYGVPYGYRGTLDWLEEVAKVIGKPVNPRLVERIEKKLRNLQPMGAGPMAGFHRQQPLASVLGDYDTILGLAKALEEMEFTVTHKICSHSLKAVEGDTENIAYYPKEKDKMEVLRSLHHQWILGSNELNQICPKDNQITCVSAPFVGKIQVATHLPFMGERGMDFLLECKRKWDEM